MRAPQVQADPGLPARVTIYEVGARDGLQNEKSVVPASVKAELIRRLGAAGLPVVETLSLIHISFGRIYLGLLLGLGNATLTFELPLLGLIGAVGVCVLWGRSAPAGWASLAGGAGGGHVSGPHGGRPLAHLGAGVDA